MAGQANGDDVVFPQQLEAEVRPAARVAVEEEQDGRPVFAKPIRELVNEVLAPDLELRPRWAS